MLAMRVALGIVLAASALASRATQALQHLPVLSPAQITALRPYTFFAGAGYCSPRETAAWTCGVFCNSLQGFVPTASGGDGTSEQFWFVGFHPPLKSVVVVHQGTNPLKLRALLTDAEIILASVDKTLFPGAPAGVRVHKGFRDAHARSADAIRSAVLTTLAAHHGAAVTLVGHSLGAALSTLDAVSLRSFIPARTLFKFVGYGTPRVGNAVFANYVDLLLPDFTRVNNKQDPIPIVPGRALGYRHPSGEVHINSTDQWLICPGQDSRAIGCIDQTEPNLMEMDLLNHPGPYDGIWVGIC